MSNTQRAADVAAAGSVAAAGTSWATQANEWFSLLASVVAVIAGLLSIYSHFKGKRKNGSIN